MNARTWKLWNQYLGPLGLLAAYIIIGTVLSVPHHWLTGGNPIEFTMTLLALPVIVLLLIIVAFDLRHRQMRKLTASKIVGFVTVTISVPILVHQAHGGTFITIIGYAPLGFFSIIGAFVIALIMACLMLAVDHNSPET